MDGMILELIWFKGHTPEREGAEIASVGEDVDKLEYLYICALLVGI